MCDKLDPFEWRFADVPAAELQACVFYEYARESTEVQADRLIWRTYFDPNQPDPGFGEYNAIAKKFPDDSAAIERIRYSPARLVLRVEDFPMMPWLRIPQPSRARAMDLADWAKMEAVLALRKKCNQGMPLEKLAFESFEIGTWVWSDEQLIERFRDWLRMHRTDPPDITPAGRTANAADLLRQLAWLRLTRHAKHKRGSSRRVTEIRDYDPRNARRSVKKAEQFLAAFYP